MVQSTLQPQHVNQYRETVHKLIGQMFHSAPLTSKSLKTFVVTFRRLHEHAAIVEAIV